MKAASSWFHLMISIHFPTEAKAKIIGPTDIYVKQGSEVMLICVVSQGPHELGEIFWLRGNCATFQSQ